VAGVGDFGLPARSDDGDAGVMRVASGLGARSAASVAVVGDWGAGGLMGAGLRDGGVPVGSAAGATTSPCGETSTHRGDVDAPSSFVVHVSIELDVTARPPPVISASSRYACGDGGPLAAAVAR